MAILKHFTETKDGMTIIWIRNHSAKQKLFASNDESMIKARMKEIRDDIKRGAGSGLTYSDIMLSLYRYAKHHGCVTVLKPTISGIVLKMRPSEAQSGFDLIIAKGKEEYILRQGPFEKISPKLKEWSEAKKNNPNILQETWEYILAKQKLKGSPVGGEEE